MVETSFVNYIVISVILFVYIFYQLPIEMAVYVEDRKIDDSFYYKSDSPSGCSIIFKRVIFSRNNKYFALIRIIIMILTLILLVFLLKSEIYKSCNCSLELWTNFDWNIFPHAEDFYRDNIFSIIVCLVHFILVHLCVFANSSGHLDDFILFNGIRLKTLSVS